MGDDHLRVPGLAPELGRGEEILPWDAIWRAFRFADLCKHVHTLFLHGPPIDGVNQPVEGKLTTYGNEYHRIDPWCCGPSEPAR